jgi:hypothetical protein
MKVFIPHPDVPQWNAHSIHVMRMLGLRPGGHLPAEGMPVRVIQGIKVWVTPYVARTYVEPWSGMARRVKSSKHRVMAECPHCGKHLSAGRLHQHKCKTPGERT